MPGSTSSISSKIDLSVRHSEDVSSTTDQTMNKVPTWWAYRQIMREAMAEFFGVMVLIIFGTGVVCQVVTSAAPAVGGPGSHGEYFSISWGWGIGTAFGVWVSGGISGGHINPAVTLSLAVWRGFPWKKVPVYILSQVLGGLVGAALVYANYFHAIDLFEEGVGVRTLKSAGLFSTYALGYMTNVSAFWSEFLATAVLMMCVLAIGDKRNAPPAGLAPLVLCLLVVGIGASLGMETGYAINPARDLGPRILTSMVGYGKAVYTFRNHYWLWCPVMGPILGAQAGAALYDVFLYDGEGSIMSRFNPEFSPKRSGSQETSV